MAVLTAFFVMGGAFASWVARIPAIQQRLAMNEAVLGVVLLGIALGALLGMPLTGGLAARFGSRQVTRGATLAYCAALLVPALMPNPAWLMLALILFGASGGIMNIAMNMQAVAVEHRYGRPIMSSFHASYSLGGMTGAYLSGRVAALGVSPQLHLIGAAVILGIIGMSATHWLLPSSIDRLGQAADSAVKAPKFSLPTRAVLGLGALATCIMLGEGSMADWGTVYLRRVLGASEATAANGYAAFSLMMTVGRLAGDRVNQRLGALTLTRCGGAMSAAGLGAALLLADPTIALIGFGCVGAGLAALVPIVYSASERQGLAPGVGLASVNTMGYLGFLGGPPVIGLVSEMTSLRFGLGLVVAANAMTILLARAVNRTGRLDPRAELAEPAP
ncbi:MAG TPA: MFS transporter [Blastocatellia bacterium]|nr:MFS transporter [Blastocatellia bacterium]